MNTSVYKSNTIEIPSYNDGVFYLYKIVQEGTFPKESIQLINKEGIPFEESSVGDKLKYELKARDVDIDLKIKIREEKSINSRNILKIGDDFYKIINIYHFTDNDGFRKTRISLGKYTLKGNIYGIGNDERNINKNA